MKRNLNKRIFINIFLVSIVILVASFILTISIAYDHYDNQYKKTLSAEAACVAEAVNENGPEYIKNYKTNCRITVISDNGTVLFDNTTDASLLDNHINRTEVQEALKSGTGYSARHSSTISEKTVNAAVRLDDGNVLRLSEVHYTVFALLGNITVSAIGLMVFAILLSVFIAYRISKSITEPINKIDLDFPDENAVYAELTPLVNKIKAQNVQISKQMEDLKIEHRKQDDMRRDFTANVSHELKTPLTSISGYAEIIKNGIAKQEDVPRFAGKIYDESRRLIMLVGDILKLSQLDDKETPAKVEKIDIYDTCKSIISQLELAAQQKGVTFDLVGKHLTINGVELIVEEMIFNILDNAVKYNKQDGYVFVSMRQCVDGVELTVTDTGVGIAKEELPHVFERFYRVDKSHSKEIGGTGLGLSIVKHAAGFLDASVSIESVPDRGTTVRVLF